MRIDKLNGAVSFEMGYPTPGRRARQTGMLAGLELDNSNPEDVIAWNLTYLICMTDDIEVTGEGEAFDTFREFWSMVQNGNKPADVVRFYLDRVHFGIHTAWLEALGIADQPIIPIPPAQKPAALLTDEERADPN